MDPPRATGATGTGPTSVGALGWVAPWESSLGPAEHTALAALLRRSFPTTPAFARGCSWAGARPERRVVGYRGDRPVAHAGVVRRFLRTPTSGGAQLVGDVGLVAVDPDRHGEGLGAALMDEVASTLDVLDVPYGFLTCAARVQGFYRRCGWAPLSDRPVRSISITHDVEDGRHNAMLLPVRGSLAGWPPGPIRRDGQEL